MPNRNAEVSLTGLPKVEIQRSIFNRNSGHKTSFNVGEVIPFYLDEVLPGDTHNIRTSVVARLQTLLTPVMDNLYLDTYYFFVPNRLVWDHWKNFCGENENGPWTMDKVDYEVPYLTYPEVTTGVFGFESGTIADYMGVPINVGPQLFAPDFSNKDYPMALPFRGYAMIINEFFRDQNLQQPCVIHKDDSIRSGSNASYVNGDVTDSDWYVNGLELGAHPFIAARFHDYFSSCLPSPQKGPAINIFGTPTNSSLVNNFNTVGPYAPVYSKSESVYGIRSDLSPSSLVPFKVFDTTGGSIAASNKLQSFNLYEVENKTVGIPAGTGQPNVNGLVPMNLWANLNIPDATINNLRLAFQLQKYYERSARGGTRYREYLAEFFGVRNGDARMQIPEYLGGHRVPLSIHQVANQSETDTAKLGDLGAMSNTSDVHDDVHMSFTEHGFLFGLCVVRFDNTYSQGLERFWSRRNILDYYNPVFAHIGEQPVYARELSLGVRQDESNPQGVDRVFGYNEAWADYRYKPSRVSGEMRPEHPQSLASWHLADDYEFAPYLGSEWIMTDKNTVDRVLAVTSEVSNQVFADFYIENKCVRAMPMHSVPGLADHF